MSEQSNLMPQLFMRRKDLEGLPNLSLPPGFTLRCFQDGDEAEWEKLIEATFNSYFNFDKEIKANPFFRKERVFFICHEGIPIATATAWCDEKKSDHTGYVHMVAAYPAYKGKGLGYQVSLATLHQMKAEGREDAVLQTDDFRLPAIKTYIKLGFEPEIIHENQNSRWENIFNALK